MRHLTVAIEFVFAALYSGSFSKNSLTDKCANRNVSSAESKTIMLEHICKTCSLVKLLKGCHGKCSSERNLSTFQQLKNNNLTDILLVDRFKKNFIFYSEVKRLIEEGAAVAYSFGEVF